MRQIEIPYGAGNAFKVIPLGTTTFRYMDGGERVIRPGVEDFFDDLSFDRDQSITLLKKIGHSATDAEIVFDPPVDIKLESWIKGRNASVLDTLGSYSSAEGLYRRGDTLVLLLHEAEEVHPMPPGESVEDLKQQEEMLIRELQELENQEASLDKKIDRLKILLSDEERKMKEIMQTVDSLYRGELNLTAEEFEALSALFARKDAVMNKLMTMFSNVVNQKEQLIRQVGQNIAGINTVVSGRNT